MDEKIIIKLSRKIEYLVHKRHRSLRHIQKAITDEGVFWMNSQYIDRKQFMNVLNQSYRSSEIKDKAQRFYYLGFSLGKIIDLGNAINTIYTLLQLFEEYDTYTRLIGPQSLENNAILRHILPQSAEPFAKLQNTQEKKFQQIEDYVESLNLSDTYAGGTNDHLETVRKPGLLQEVSSPSHLRGNHAMPLQQPEEVKVDLKFRSCLPATEQHFNDFDDYIMKTSSLSASHQNTLSDHHHRIHGTKVDPKAPNFKILSCHASPLKLNYCEVAELLIDMLILIYNKMYDNQFLTPQMLIYIEKIDHLIVNKVIKALCEDINKVTRHLAVKQLAKINKVLKMDTVTRNPELKKIASDDEKFEIVVLDLEANNRQDLMLLNSVAGQVNAGSIRVSSEKPETGR